ncbi:MAG: hypothetical protein RLY86_907 [Pseudomonadota bacterium]|jgi:DNA-nicking Smr family endonuclease
MTRRPPTPTEAEIQLWRTVMADAAPVKRRRRSAPAPDGAGTGPVAVAPAPAADPAPAPATPAALAPTGRKRPLATPVTPAPPEAALPLRVKAAVTVDRAPPLLGAKAGLDRRTEDKVRRGRLPIDGRIDLHGMTQDRAHDTLLAFVRRSHAEGRRLLLVITGKGPPGQDHDRRAYDGRGVLRSAVPRWLNEGSFRPMVLAVHQAQPQHGGSGALYVFLKRRR